MLDYLAVKLITGYTMELFYREVEVIGKQNIPADGPTIIYGNHNNVFTDAFVENY